MKTYAYTTEAVSGTPTTETYVYNSTIKDRLHSYKGSVISYDANGYPTKFTSGGVTHTFTWTKGKLTKYVKSTSLAGTSTYTYTYDGYGRRISKRYSFMKGSQSMVSYVTMSLTNYTYDTSGRLIRENYTETYNDLSSNSRDILYLYDESGIVGAIQKYNSTTETFYFDRNIKGDVIGIYNASGTRIAKYSYDSWGNSKVTTLSSNNFSAYNPIRYRGYYFDAESGFYFLNARYYNPQWRKFISPDDTAYLDPDTPNGLNLYAYCNNDPANCSDPSGNSVIGALLLGVAIGAVVGGAIGYVSAKYIYEDLDIVRATLMGALFGGIIGGAVGLAIGSGAGSVAAKIGTTFLWKGLKSIVSKGISDTVAYLYFGKKGGNIIEYMGAFVFGGVVGVLPLGEDLKIGIDIFVRPAYNIITNKVLLNGETLSKEHGMDYFVQIHFRIVTFWLPDFAKPAVRGFLSGLYDKFKSGAYNDLILYLTGAY